MPQIFLRCRRFRRRLIVVYATVFSGVLFLLHMLTFPTKNILPVNVYVVPTEHIKRLDKNDNGGREKVSESYPRAFSFENGSYAYLHPSFNLDSPQVKEMLEKRTEDCNGQFTGFAGKFGILRNVVLDPTKSRGREGGESIASVVNQKEEDEYMELSKGYFKMKCSSFSYQFGIKDHLKKWFDAIAFDNGASFEDCDIENNYTIAVTRYEYANLYHTMTDYYNTFLSVLMFKLNPDTVNILWIDGHPMGALDGVWDTLFGKVVRVGTLKKPTLYKNMIWNMLSYFSPLNQHDLPTVPYLEEFRDFFLKRHGIYDLNRKVNCSKLSILFLWRRDYLAHPRNPKGHVVRKVKNENELIKAVEDSNPGHEVKGIQIDLLPIRTQLQTISDTDILIGMHGAGLSHTLFLQKHAGLVELYPTYWSSANRHFRAMAKWRNLHYNMWQNTDQSKELPDHYTIVPENVVVKMVHEMQHKICGDHQ